jgi:predicted RNA-binding protein with PIN domain
VSLHIVIDGYNLIRQSRQFSALDRQDLQSGREALVEALAAYKKIKGYTITVVFDGAQAPSHMHRRDFLKGIELRYSNPRELADTVIKRLAARDRQKLLVVTSDSDIVRYAQSMGAAVIPSAEFEERLIMASQMDLNRIEPLPEHSEGWPATTRKKGPSRRLPKRKRRMDKRISRL